MFNFQLIWILITDQVIIIVLSYINLISFKARMISAEVIIIRGWKIGLRLMAAGDFNAVCRKARLDKTTVVGWFFAEDSWIDWS